MSLQQEGVHADQRQAAAVFLVFVLLDLAARVHGVHGAERRRLGHRLNNFESLGQ